MSRSLPYITKICLGNRPHIFVYLSAKYPAGVKGKYRCSLIKVPQTSVSLAAPFSILATMEPRPALSVVEGWSVRK
jgi:hypothetical protein